jgi:hypothetical protein
LILRFNKICLQLCIITIEHCALDAEFQHFILRFNKISLQLCIITIEHCALDAEFQHFILRFNKISFQLWIQLKQGIGGEKEAQRQGEARVTLRIIDSIIQLAF